MPRDVFEIVGTTQAQYFRIERVVAEGGFGVVYQAYHTSFRAPVALKCLKVPESMSDDAREEFLEKFRAEGELLFRLSQAIPAVVRPLHVDALEIRGRLVPFLALEWLEGETLDRLVLRRAADGRRPMPIDKCVKLLAPIAQALARAHRFPGPDGAECVIHRDLKPENIFLARIGGAEVPKILDFGIARTKSAAAHEAGRVTDGERTNSFTPGYAAPEQWLPKRFGQAGPWTDVYGLATTMVEVLTGRAPVEGDFASMMGSAIDEVRRPTPRNEGATLPDAAEEAFALALAVDPRKRAQSIQEFWTPLELALGMTPSIREQDLEPAPAAPSTRWPGRDDLGAPAAAAPTIDLPVPTLVGVVAVADTAPAPRGPTLASAGRPASAIPDLDAPDRTAPRHIHRVIKVSVALPDDDRPNLGAPLADVPPPVAPPIPIRGYPREGAPERSIAERVRPAVRVILLALAIAIGDGAYAYFEHEPLTLGGVRPVWLAGPLVALGIGLAAWRLLAAQD